MAFRCAAAASGILYKDRKNHLPNRKNRGECIFFGQKYLFSENMSIFAVPNREVFGCGKHLERCRSGRSGRTRNAVYGQLYRGFESLSLRQETTQKIANPCKSRIYRDFYFGRNAEKGIEKRVTCGLFGVLFSGPKKYTELLVTDWFAPVCSGLPLDMRHLGN